MAVLGTDTNQMTAASLKALPCEIELIEGNQAWLAGTRVDNVDILHLEEHGSAINNQIGDVLATALASTFANVPIALLWSCCSGAANSWGESPALCLHRGGAGMVMSFLAELHNLDAQSISTAFYNDVFGPAASRDPEAALVRIRANKFANEFAFANWASMAVYMRAPIDMSALPLNGPRVPQAQWSHDCVASTAIPGVCTEAMSTSTAVGSRGLSKVVNETAAPDVDELLPARGATSTRRDLWAELANTVGELQPGTLNEFHGFEDLPKETTIKLPASAFKAWRGNVIRLAGGDAPLDDATLRELNIDAVGPLNMDASLLLFAKY
jgi:hypothetical protein